MEELLRRLGNPERELSIVHIAGTNGKGSILSFIERVLIEGGYHTGRYVSPAVGAYEERFLLDGEPVAKENIAGLITQVKMAAEQMNAEGFPLPTVFEMETAMAFLCFYKARVSVVLLETGMGGRLDATNVITKPLLSIIASVSMDHMAALGETLTEIAGEKAGIIKENCPTLLYPFNPPEVKTVIEEECKKKSSPFYEIDLSLLKNGKEEKDGSCFDYGTFKNLSIKLPGHHQIMNAVTAIKAVDILKNRFPMKEEQLREALKKTQWRARLQKISETPLIYLDGAHNYDGAKQLERFIKTHFKNERVLGVMGVLKDKEYDKIASCVLPLMEKVVTITPDNPRALDGKLLKKTAQKYCQDVISIPNPKEGLEWMKKQAAPEDVIIVFGSLSFMDQIGESDGTISEDCKA
ncbi:MAG: folylpolyglutamate synthase/dihydrofolate synthase family protein [Lachnospiraceae bacterium]|nr:folylpolyglutamate synthase/dihydrofolate synthase family protein [Lachnospiraceae bacterium]